MSSDQRGFLGFFRRKDRKNRPFAEFLERERMPESKEEGKEAFPAGNGRKSLDELFVDWDSGAESQEDLSRSLRWEMEAPLEGTGEADSVSPPEPTEPADLLVEFPPLFGEEELAQLIERRDTPDMEEEPSSPAEDTSAKLTEVRPVPLSEDREEHPESDEEGEEESLSGRSPQEGQSTSAVPLEEHVLPEAVLDVTGELREIHRLVAELEVRVARRRAKGRSGG